MKFKNRGQKEGFNKKPIESVGEVEQELHAPTQSDGQDIDSANQKVKKNVGARTFKDGTGSK